MLKTVLLTFSILLSSVVDISYKLPINTINRNRIGTLRLTEIGDFGLVRKERPGVPEHFHTGIDIKRPSENYHDEPIFPVSEGIIISMRQDGPFVQLIIEHSGDNKIWTVYEHIAGIEVNLFQRVSPDEPIARFMNKNELDRYGWQFDHFHFELIKVQPVKLIPENSTPQRLFSSYTLMCHSQEDLSKYFYNPIEFFEVHLK